jgi:glycosyltransferase involved in cell wall biosynthesis
MIPDADDGVPLGAALKIPDENRDTSQVNRDGPAVSIVAPVYRNAATLRELARRIATTLASTSPDYELILVDDGSPDEAWRVIDALAREDVRVRGIRLSRNFGQHAAIAAGFDHARGAAIVLMDADLQDRPEELPVLLARLGGDVDVVYTIKRGGEGTGSRTLTSRLFHATFQRITRRAVPADIGTYRAFSRKVLLALRQYPEANVVFGPLMFFVGFNAAYVETVRAAGGSGSNYTFLRRLGLAGRSLASYTDLPARVFLTGGLLLGAAVLAYALLIGLQAVLLGAVLPSGITLLLLVVLVGLALMMLGFGVIGFYLFQVYQEVLRRPRYLVADSRN